MECTVKKVSEASDASSKEGPELAVRMDSIRFGWDQQRPPVLDFQSLEIKAGERLFIEGPSGSGKTTLLGLLAGILVPQAGEVTVLEQRIEQLSAAERDRFRADHIGYIHQMFNLIPYLSVIENVTLPARFSNHRKCRMAAAAGSVEAEARRLLECLGLSDPELIQRKVTALSVGQQQRVAAARALIGSPEVIIADEPTSALDTANRASFIELLFQECAVSKSTLIFVSHDTSLGAMFDRTVHLDGGAAC